MIISGTVFALQGHGILGGPAVIGNSFWIYAGTLVVVAVLIVAIVSFHLGSINRSSAQTGKGGVGSGTGEHVMQDKVA